MGKMIRKFKAYLRGRLLYNQSEISLRRIMGIIKDNATTGDYLEFGVYRGDSMKYAMTFAEEMKFKNMRFYGFDSFQGMPAHKEGGTLKQGDYFADYEKVNEYLKLQKFDYYFYLIKGWFNAVRIPDNVTDVAVVNIDCDFYSSTKDALNLIKPFLKEGMIIRFDDWYLFNATHDRGEPKAFVEFIQTVPEFSFMEVPDASGKIFIVKENGK